MWKPGRSRTTSQVAPARQVFLFAFDLLELDGEDLRRESFETRKAMLASVLRGCRRGCS